ncbi:legume-like lectin family-domain-containing protein [Powellomyces hirtus]|nr:legume-like lectin family-domain-containing protein [Powellomyces hirtus]
MRLSTAPLVALCGLALLCQPLAVIASTGTHQTQDLSHHEPPYLEADKVPRRHDYRQVFKKPFYLYDEEKIPYFEENGHVILTPDYVRLTPSVPDSAGAIWATQPNPHKEWQVEFSFSVFGRGYMGGEGLAFWYTKEKGTTGPMYGSKDKWDGLAILFDTGDQQENRYTPYVYGQMNDGSELAHRKDYVTTAMAGCFRDYRNTPAPVWARVTYANHTVRLDLDLRQHGDGYIECFTKEGVDLPANYYFGLSAATEAHLADDHDVISFEVYELNPKIAKKHVERPHEAEHVNKEGVYHLTDDVRQIIERIEAKVDQAREQQIQREEPGYQEQPLDSHAIEKIEGNQFHIIEALNVIQQKLGEPTLNHDATSAVRAETQHEMVKDQNWKMDDVIRRLTALSEDVKHITSGNAATLDTLRILQETTSHLTNTQSKYSATSSTPASATASGHLTAGAIGFVVGVLAMWIVSLLRRVGEEKSKKFI